MDKKQKFGYSNGTLVVQEGQKDITSKDVAQFRSKLTKVILPASVTTIGEYTFKGFEHLTSVIAPSVVNIKKDAFSECKRLKTVEIPVVEEIGENAFDHCEDLVNIELPNTLVSVGDYAFNHSGITNIIIPDSVQTIGEQVFWFSNLSSISFGNSVRVIKHSAFESCFSLRKIELPNSLEVIEGWAFALGKFDSIVIPGSVRVIEEGTFYSADLKSIKLPNSVQAIGARAFKDCKNLESIEIPDSVETIGEEAFAGCKNLKEVRWPANLKKIGDLAFCGCNNLEKPKFSKNTDVSFTAFKSPGTLQKYKDLWDFVLTLPALVAIICFFMNLTPALWICGVLSIGIRALKCEDSLWMGVVSLLTLFMVVILSLIFSWRTVPPLGLCFISIILWIKPSVNWSFHHN